jgi:hypothetical protein
MPQWRRARRRRKGSREDSFRGRYIEAHHRGCFALQLGVDPGNLELPEAGKRFLSRKHRAIAQFLADRPLRGLTRRAGGK